MPLPLNHMKERLHLAYVRAVVARAGATFQPYDEDYGIDARISAVSLTPDGKYIAKGSAFDCQLKATTDWEIKDEHIVYDLDVKAYNNLVELKERLGILILYRLPKQPDPDAWVTVSKDNLTMRTCCYWKLLTGDKTTNTSTKQICIPTQQLFDHQAVTDLLEEVRKRNEEFRRWRMSQ